MEFYGATEWKIAEARLPITSEPIYQLLAGSVEDRMKELKKKEETAQLNKLMVQLLDSLLLLPPSSIRKPRWMLYQASSRPQASANRQISLKRVFQNWRFGLNGISLI